MGLSEKDGVGVLASPTPEEGSIWVISGSIALRAPLKMINTKLPEKNSCHRMEEEEEEDQEEEEADEQETTPKAKMTPERLLCPPPPKKPRPSLRCHLHAIEFFTPPELESVFLPN